MRRAALLLTLLSGIALGGDEEIDDLIRRLGHGVEAVRQDAALKLQDMGPAAERAIPALTEAMRDDVLWADDALVAIGAPAVPALRSLLADPGNENDEIDALGRIGPAAAAAAPSIARLLRDPAPYTRAIAATTLGRIGSREVVDSLRDALSDPVPRVRAAVAASLWALGAGNDATLAVAIDAFLDDPSLSSREALVAIGPATVEPLVNAYGKLNDETKEAAIRVFEELEAHARPATKLLVHVVAEDRTAGTSLRHAGARALAAIGLEDADTIAALKPRLIDPACCAEILEALSTLGGPAVPTIAGVLELGIDDAQRQAVRTLKSMGPTAAAARDTLRGCLDDPRTEIAIHAAFALLRIDPDSEEALATLKRSMSAGEPGWRRPEPYGFAHAGAPAVAAVTAWLSDENAQLRTMAAITFAVPTIEEPFPEAALVRALSDKHAPVRQWSARALAHTEAGDALRRALKDPERAVRFAAVESLVAIDAVAALDVDPLIEALLHGDESEQGAAIYALGQLRASKAAPHLVRFVWGGDSRADEAREALIALGKPAIPALIEEMDRQTLALIGDASIPALLQAARSDDPERRSWALWALGSYRHIAEQMIPVFTAALEDEDSGVRSRAASCLGDIGPLAKDAALDKLRSMLDDGTGAFSEFAEAIWSLSEDASLVLPSIRPRSTSESEAERINAFYLLAWILPHSPEAEAFARSLLDSADPGIRLEAAFALVRKSEPDARTAAVLMLGLADGGKRLACGSALHGTGALAHALRHEDIKVRHGAAQYMTEFGIPGQEEFEALLIALASEDPELRRWAAKCFAYESTYGHQAEPVLADRLADPWIEVAIAAAEALAANGIRRKQTLPLAYAAMGRDRIPLALTEAIASRGPEVVPDLMRYLKEGTVRERGFAALALGHVGRAASPTLDILMDLSKSEETRIAVSAGQAVRQILAEIPPKAIGVGGRK